MGAAATSAMQEEPKAERVMPSIVFNWNQAKPMRMNAPEHTVKTLPYTHECKAGAFLGIEFRQDDSFARIARMHRRHAGFFKLRNPLVRATHQASGVTILNVLHGTAAETMGLLPGDVIVEMDKTAIRSAAQLASQIRERCVGEQTELRVHRGDKVKVLRGFLKSRLARGCVLDE